MKQVVHHLTAVLCLAVASIQLASCVPSLQDRYPFSTYIEAGYRVHWNFDLKQQTIDIAVNVSTNGWIGFGISPTGKMVDSDIVIGWVNKDGKAQFHDRFAVLSYILPPIDKSQDWQLLSSDQKNGYTVLEFTRDLVTCDDKEDVDIKTGITHVIYAYHSLGPNSTVTLDSLTPEKLGSSSFVLIPGNIDFNQLKIKKCGKQNKMKGEL